MKKLMTFLAVLAFPSAVLLAQYENFNLSPGFLPDPAVGTGVAGGPVDASSLGNTSHGPCVGQIDSTPDHVMTLSSSFSYLKVSATSNADTSLVIKGPGGTRCNDDTNGLDPAISGSWGAGRYEIYIGDVDGRSGSYTLSITEIR